MAPEIESDGNREYRCRAKILPANPTFRDMVQWTEQYGLKRIVELNGRYFALSPVSVDGPTRRGDTPAVQNVYPFLLLMNRHSSTARDEVVKILRPELFVLARLLEPNSTLKKLEELREIYGHTIVVECRGKIFLLCNALGDFQDCLDADSELVVKVRNTYPYVLKISPVDISDTSDSDVPPSLYMATDILTVPQAS